MRKGMLLLSVIVVLVLAACGGDKKNDQPESPGQPAASESSASATQAPAAAESTAEATASTALDFTPVEPGQHIQSGLTLLSSNSGTYGGTGYYWGEVRNDTGQTLSRIEAQLDLLDGDNYRLGSADLSPLLTEIPTGQSFYIGGAFNTADGFADTALWVRYVIETPALNGVFNLPAQVDARGPGESAPYTVTGRAQNSSGGDLLFPVIDVALVGPDDTLVGLAHAAITGGLGENGTWPTGGEVTFEAAFSFVPVEIEQIQDVNVAAAGYTLR